MISGRELGTGERWFRDLLAPLDIVPGLGAAKKFVTAGKVTSKVADFSKIGLKSADLAKVRQSIGNTVQTARTKGLERISQLKEAGKATAIAAGKKLEKGVIYAGKVIDKGITAGKQATSNLSPQHVTPEGVLMREGVENTQAVENIFRGQMENVKGVFGSGKNADRIARCCVQVKLGMFRGVLKVKIFMALFTMIQKSYTKLILMNPK